MQLLGAQVCTGTNLCARQAMSELCSWLQDDGFIAKILVQQGAQDIKVGTALAVMVEESEDVAAFADYKPEAPSSGSEAPKGKQLPSSAALCSS